MMLVVSGIPVGHAGGRSGRLPFIRVTRSDHRSRPVTFLLATTNSVIRGR